MNLSFFLFRIFAWTISRMPFWMIYGISGFLYVILRYIIRYRADVIRENLRHSFAEKPLGEIKEICREFYRGLADVILEVMKLEHIRPDELKKRVTFSGLDLLQNSVKNQRNSIIATGHLGNWEWMGTALGLVAPCKGFAIVKPLTNKDFNGYMEMLRNRLHPGSTIPFRSAFREMVRKKHTVNFFVIAGDQTPTWDEANFWAPFLNRETPFFLGIEKISRSLDHDVYFANMKRTGRGRYHCELQRITDRPGMTREDEITLLYIHLLEEAIREAPSNWLWSHRRWKHNRSAEST